MSMYIFDEKTGVIMVPCRICHRREIFRVNPEGFRKWRTGEVIIQEALPDVSVANRELLISNICGNCFETLFEDDSEDEEECLYPPKVFDPSVSMDYEVQNKIYLNAMQTKHVGDRVRHIVSSPGIGYVDYLITKMDETGVWAIKLLSTMQVLTIKEAS